MFSFYSTSYQPNPVLRFFYQNKNSPPNLPSLLEQHGIISPFFLDVAKFTLLLVVSVTLRNGSLLRKPFHFLGGVLRGLPLWASILKYIAPSRRASFMT